MDVLVAGFELFVSDRVPVVGTQLFSRQVGFPPQLRSPMLKVKVDDFCGNLHFALGCAFGGR
jgi:hypothetical protein